MCIICIMYILIQSIVLPAVLTGSSIGVGHITGPACFAPVLLILPSLGGSPEESLAGVAAHPSVVHVGHGQVPAHSAVVHWLW